MSLASVVPARAAFKRRRPSPRQSSGRARRLRSAIVDGALPDRSTPEARRRSCRVEAGCYSWTGSLVKRRHNLLLVLATALALVALVMAAAGLLLAFKDEAAGGRSPQASGPPPVTAEEVRAFMTAALPALAQGRPRGVERRLAGLRQGQEDARQPRDAAGAAALAPPRGVGDGAAGAAGGVRHRHQRGAPRQRPAGPLRGRAGARREAERWASRRHRRRDAHRPQAARLHGFRPPPGATLRRRGAGLRVRLALARRADGEAGAAGEGARRRGPGRAQRRARVHLRLLLGAAGRPVPRAPRHGEAHQVLLGPARARLRFAVVARRHRHRRSRAGGP